ncbi:MAG: hypothetical protein AABX52_00750 [Nanoarchaeota archaeon]
MAIISVNEIIDLVIMTFAVGFIFKDAFKTPSRDYDPLLHYSSFNKSLLWESVLVTAPAIVLHEFAHKLVGLAFGLEAVFHASYGGLFIGVLLKFLNSPFVFFVPGFVEISSGNLITSALTSFAGPGMNGLLWLFCLVTLTYKSKIKVATYHRLILTKKINGFLFIFNMLPIPGFDGFRFFASVINLF